MSIKKISTVNMSHEDWLEVRKKTIGGSEAAGLCGMNKYMSPYSIYCQKKGLTSPPEINEAMRQGTDLEDYVAKRFSETTGKKVRNDNHIIYNDKYPFAHANVDRVIVGEDAGLECKTTSMLNLRKFQGGEYPENYYVQCMHYMMVTGKSKWYLAVLILGKDFLVYEIERDENEISALASIESEFYERLKSDTAPEIDGDDPTTKAINEMYPESISSDCDLTPYATEIKSYKEVDAQIKTLKKIKDQKANVIKDYMKLSEYGYCGNNKVMWKTATRTSFNQKLLMQEHPEIDYTRYIKITPTRTFKIL